MKRPPPKPVSYETLLEQASDTIIVLDANGYITYANSAVRDLLGREPADIIGVNGVRNVHHDDQDAVTQRVQRVAGIAGRGTPFTYRLQHADGHWVPVESTRNNLLDDPDVNGVILTIRDISDRLAAAEALRASETKLVALGERSSDLTAILDASGKVSWVAPSVRGVLGYEGAEFLARSHDGTLLAEEGALGDVLSHSIEAPGTVCHGRIELRHNDNEWRTFDISVTNLLADAAIGGLVCNGRDVTDTLVAQASSERAAALFATSFEMAPIGMAVTDLDGVILDCNRAMAIMVGRERNQIVGMNVTDITHPDDIDEDLAARERLFSDATSTYQRDKRYLHTNGTVIDVELSVALVRDSDGTPLRMVGQMRDVTRSRHVEASLVHSANHDSLTGLANRALFLEKLEAAIQASDAGGSDDVAVLFLDLDRFKVVNDSLGHGAGDQLLVAVAERICSAVRQEDLVARFGGDEFAVLCLHLGQSGDARNEARALAQRVLDALNAPVAVTGGEAWVGGSIGIAFAGSGDVKGGEVLRDADAAMYSAKDAGRGRITLFGAELGEEMVRRHAIETSLHRAVERGELRMHYQPVVELGSGEVQGVEALIRWERPGVGLVGPDEFLDVAEDSGIIVDVGDWALREVCRQITVWDEVLGEASPHSIAVNLSARQLTQPGVASAVADIITSSGVDPARLCLEVTETALLDDTERVRNALGLLKDLGVELAVDDFGTGYSSLSYLQRFPFDVVKIDQSFVTGIANDPIAGAIVAAVTGLARALGMRVVAEGVEDGDDVEELINLGCTAAQGYLYGRPMPPAELAALLSDGPVLLGPGA